MSTIKISRLLRLALKERLSSDFNGVLQEACSEFGIEPYSLNFSQDSLLGLQNFYEGNRSLDDLNLHQEPDLPAMTMWTGEGGQYGPGQRSMPTTFSGSVTAHWRFFLSVKGLRSTGLIDLREATEAAMVALLAEEFSEFTYRGDLSWQPLNEQIWLDQDAQHLGFVQQIEYTASFEVIA
ncbi:MAG TPA: hypothetical protein VGH38_14110 [Bryobacteraceae bacterium]|jgi:hypothetical protein